MFLKLPIGANLQFYPENTKLTVVDPNPFFKQHLLKNIEKVIIQSFSLYCHSNFQTRTLFHFFLFIDSIQMSA